jgi:type IV pilus assembly protein PilN
LSSEQAQTQEGNHSANAPVTVPGAVQFEILSGYNPLPAKPAKAKGSDKDAETDLTNETTGPRTKKSPKFDMEKVTGAPPTSESSASSGKKVTKAPVQKGAPR